MEHLFQNSLRKETDEEGMSENGFGVLSRLMLARMFIQVLADDGRLQGGFDTPPQLLDPFGRQLLG